MEKLKVGDKVIIKTSRFIGSRGIITGKPYQATKQKKGLWLIKILSTGLIWEFDEFAGEIIKI